MVLKSSLIAYTFFIFAVFLISRCPVTESSNKNGFTIDLIHRDSPQSPSYDSSLVPSQRLVNALKRSFHRINRLKANHSTQLPEPDIINGNGEFFIKYSIGTPPVPSLGIADTGSDIIWTQCEPCLECFKQKLPLFTPKKSSTYRTVACKSAPCGNISGTACDMSGKKCLYAGSYGDGSFTGGDFSRDTFTLGSTKGKMVSFRKVKFGCGYRNGGTFSGVESGIVGLGGGSGSLVRQLGSSINGKFSYCLVLISHVTNSSKLHFGTNAVVSGKNIVSTPLVSMSPETYYFLTLEGISVGNQRLEFYDSALLNDQEGNIIIDSGTTLTILPLDFYNKLESAVKSVVKLKQIQDPDENLNLCYSARESMTNYPEIIVHFRGADVTLKPENSFVKLNEDLVCLAFKPVYDIAIYGNLAQMNFLVGYDLKKKTVSFKPTDCSKL